MCITYRYTHTHTHSWLIVYYVTSVMSDFLKPHGLWPVRILCLWDSPGENSGVSCHALLQIYIHIYALEHIFWIPRREDVSLFSTLPLFVCHEVMGLDAMIIVFWMLSFKPALSLSSFTFIKRLFSSSSLSAMRVVSFVYLRLLIFLLAI